MSAEVAAGFAGVLHAMTRLFEARAAAQRGFWENMPDKSGEVAAHRLGKAAAYREAAHECRLAAEKLKEEP